MMMLKSVIQNYTFQKKHTQMKKFFLITMITFAFAQSAFGQQKLTREITFDAFLQQVLVNNLEFIFEKYEVEAAEAILTASKVFEDPELEMIFPTFDRDEFGEFPRNISFEMQIPIEMFGKRRNRIRAAEAEKVAATHNLEDFLRHLKADAATVFSSVLTHQMLLDRMNLTKTQLQELLEANQYLFEVGEIGEIDVIQTRLETRNFESELLDTQAELAELFSEAYFILGGIPTDSLVFTGELIQLETLLSYEDLVENALKNRPDILMSKKMVDAADYERRLARSERLPNLTVVAGYFNEQAIRPMPGIEAVYGGLIIPLQFSGFNRGTYVESLRRLDQAKVISDATILQAETELLLSWEKLQLLNQKRTIYTESILQDAERVRDATIFSYQQGEVSLLAVLEAQRTMNEVFENYYQTLEQYTHALIELSKASGQWFVNF